MTRRMLVLLLGLVASRTSAQAPSEAATSHTTQITIAIAPRSSFAERVADRLRAGLGAEPAAAAIEVATTFVACAASPTPANDTVIVRVEVAADHAVKLCVSQHGTITERSIEPFAALDAAAVEQIATMIEASIEALAATAESTDAEPANTTQEDEAPAAPEVQTPEASIAEAASLGAAEPATSITAAPDAPANDPTARHHRNYTIAAGYELAAWDSAWVHGLRASAQRRLLSDWLWLELGALHNFGFEVTVSPLGARFSAWSFDARAAFNVTLSRQVKIEVTIGPRIEVLSVKPFANDDRARSDASQRAISFDAVIDVGPRVRITEALWLSLRVGTILVLNPRSYGFYERDRFITVLEHGAARPYLHAGAQVTL